MSILLTSCLRKNPCLFSSMFPANSLQEYNIILTRPSSTKISSRLKYGAKMRNQENSSKPFVVILGWNDCKPKHLEKYSNIFEAKGWSTVCLPTKSFNTFFRSGTKVKKIGLYIAEVIKAQTQKDQPVFLYSFSNGGCAVYFHLTEALTSTVGGPYYNSVNVVGSIFDSCPVKPTIESVRRVQISITEHMKNPLLRPIVWYTVGFVLPLLVKNNPVLQRFFDDLGKIPLKCPQLFLYSKADHLAFCDDIEEHMKERKARGVKVFSKCWEDSPHVQHYMKYQDEYLKLLDEFLTVCLQEQN